MLRAKGIAVILAKRVIVRWRLWLGIALAASLGTAAMAGYSWASSARERGHSSEHRAKRETPVSQSPIGETTSFTPDFATQTVLASRAKSGRQANDYGPFVAPTEPTVTDASKRTQEPARPVQPALDPQAESLPTAAEPRGTSADFRPDLVALLSEIRPPRRR